MHLLWYGRNILELHGFSTWLSALILGGAGAGYLALIIALLSLGGRKPRVLWQYPPSPPPPPPPPHT